MNKQKLILVWTNLCRIFLAAVFIFSGFIKANDPLGTAYKIQDYLEAWELTSLSYTVFPYITSMVLGIFEFFLGINLLLGIRRRLMPFVTLVVMLVMTPITLWLALDNPISDCGCFGDAIILSNWETFAKNVILLIAAVSIFVYRNSILRLVSNKVDWMISLYSIVFIICFTLYCYTKLPVFDFRPFSIGTDIYASMSIPEDAKKSVFETVFVYKKDGVKKKFTVDDYPKDTTWTFVDAETVLVERGYEPPIKDFTIITQEEGIDITEDVTTDRGYTFLLIAPRMSEADDSDIDLINEVYDYSTEHGYRFLCLTASPDEDIEMWKDNTGAEYPFALSDEITLKTIVRSSPGLVLIKDGKIINKWSSGDIPDEYQLAAPLEKLPIGELNHKTVMRRIVGLLGWFILPLFILFMADLLGLSIQNLKKKRTSHTN